MQRTVLRTAADARVEAVKKVKKSTSNIFPLLQ